MSERIPIDIELIADPQNATVRLKLRDDEVNLMIEFEPERARELADKLTLMALIAEGGGVANA